MNCLTNSLCLPMIFTPFVDPEVRNIWIVELHMAYSSCWCMLKIIALLIYFNLETTHEHD
jgi:hypothetical protein